MSGEARAADLRDADGRLRPCPPSPNCVCSEEAGGDAGHAIAPFSIAGAPAAAWAALHEVVAGWPRARLVQRTPDYLHAEFRSRLLRFVDDVEFRLDAAAGVIHVRSASRLGHSDFGVNRRRVEELRIAFAARLARGG